MTTQNISRFAWQMSRLVAWAKRHEFLAEVLVALFLTAVLGCLLLLAMEHDALWYAGMIEAL